jgi:hypothetical protein
VKLPLGNRLLNVRRGQRERECRVFKHSGR